MTERDERSSWDRGPDTFPLGRFDRVVLVLWTASMVLTTIGLIPAFLLMPVASLGLFARVGYWFLVPCVLSDLISGYVLTSHLLGNRGPSVVPLIALLYYALFTVFHMQAVWWVRLITLVGLTLFHVCCQWWVPLAIVRWAKRKHDASTV